MKITGKVEEIGTLQVVSEKFKKREIVIEYAENPQYPEYIKFETHNDKTDVLNALKVNDTVDVEFNLKGKPWTNKDGKTNYFNSLVIWRVAKVADGGTPATVDINSSTDDGSDLPF